MANNTVIFLNCSNDALSQGESNPLSSHKNVLNYKNRLKAGRDVIQHASRVPSNYLHHSP